jgi:hypothetical protein
MLWWFDYHIHDSCVSEYSATDTSNSGVGKYYVTKKNKTYDISDSNISEWTNKINLNQYMHIFLFVYFSLKRKGIVH